MNEWIIASGASVLNTASQVFTFDNHRSRSDIDVTFANEAARVWATYDWRVDFWELSDHNIITVEVTPDPSSTVESLAPVPQWKLSNASWRRFSVELRSAAQSLEELEESPLDDHVSALRSIVHEVCDRVIGRRIPAARGNVIWWNPELSTKRQEVRRLRRRLQAARRSGTDDAEQLAAGLRFASGQYKKLILTTKEQNWRDFVGRHNDDPWGHVYRICRGRKKTTDLGCLRSNGALSVTWHDCANMLLRNFFPVAESTARDDLPPGAPPILEAFEVATSVAKLRSRRSPGMDGITGGIVKEVWRAIPQHLTKLYSRCLSEGYFPAEWKHPRVIPLLKGPDKDRSDPASYRGICLLPVFGKALEGIMVNRLKDVLPDGCRWQFGFRPGRCVEDAWMHAKNTVANSRERRVLGIFVDFKGAFDNVEWSAVLDRLVEVGCREIDLWKSYFSGRSASIISRYEAATVAVTRGCPQGSVSGPFIWNLLMDVLLQRLEPHCALSAFADDLLLFVDGNSRADLERKGEQLMDIVGAWGAEVGVSVSTSKTAIMLLKGQLSRTRRPTVRFAGASLPYVTKCRYLGILVGERLSFLPHISALRDRLAGVAGGLARVLRVDWGLSSRAKRTIYSGLMVPCALFGASVWYKAVSRGRSLKLLTSCQRSILLGCLPVCRTVSTVALQVLAGAPPMDLDAHRIAVKFKLRKDVPLDESDWLHGQDLSVLDWKAKMALLDERLLNEWQLRWDRAEHGSVTREFFPEAAFVYKRKDFVFTLKAGFLLTGHGSMNAFLQGRTLSTTTACSCGVAREDWRHILCECRLYNDLRDLDALGVVQDHGRWIVAGVVETPERMRLLGVFADAAFSRRRMDAMRDEPQAPGR